MKILRKFRSRLFSFLSAAPTPKSVRGMGPAIIVIVIVLAAALGYYQIVYYPAHQTTSTTTALVLADPHNVTVTILPGAASATRDLTYSPNLITVVVGYNATVIWLNNDTSTHTVTANASDSTIDPRFTTFGPIGPQSAWNNIVQGQKLNFTFTNPGTYGYFCSYHSNMAGTIKVVANPNGTSSATGSLSTSTLIPKPVSVSQSFLFFLIDGATIFAKSLATLIGSGTAPWSVNLSRNLFACLSVIPAALTKIR